MLRSYILLNIFIFQHNVDFGGFYLFRCTCAVNWPFFVVVKDLFRMKDLLYFKSIGQIPLLQ